MIQAMTDRQQVRIWLEGAAKDDLESIQDRYGMKQQELLSRMVRWFVAQDEGVQAGILDILPRGHEAGVARAILAKMAGTPHASGVVEDD